MLGLQNVIFSLTGHCLLARNLHSCLPVPLSEGIRRVTESRRGERSGCPVSLRAPDRPLRGVHTVGPFSQQRMSQCFSFSYKKGLTPPMSVHTSLHVEFP